jgi:peptidoglycan/LPS O-acetylase OafA/YrhL
MFYLFFPFACLLFRRVRFLLIFLVVFALIGPFARVHAFNQNPVWGEYSYLGGMDAIALGCLTALLVAKRRLAQRVLWTFGSLGTALLVLILGFSVQTYTWGLGRMGLDMTILALGACMVVVAVAQTQWAAPRILTPLLKIGQRSYEVYLTHVFVVLGMFNLFVVANKPMKAVPALFVAVIILAGVLGELVARYYSEPMNRWLRKRWGDEAGSLGSVVESDRTSVPEESRVSA